MNNTEKVTYWIDISDYDMETSKTMLKGRRYLYVGFMCHQAVEKILKAYFTAKKEETPPYVHNLKRLAEECRSLSILSLIPYYLFDIQLNQNYLLGEKGIQINAYMAATAWNLKKMMEKLMEKFLYFIFRRLFQQNINYIAA